MSERLPIGSARTAAATSCTSSSAVEEPSAVMSCSMVTAHARSVDVGDQAVTDDAHVPPIFDIVCENPFLLAHADRLRDETECQQGNVARAGRFGDVADPGNQITGVCRMSYESV